MQLLQALPEAKLEALLTLSLVPEVLKLINVSSAVAHEESAHIGIEIFISLVIVGGKVNCSCKLLLIVFPSLRQLVKEQPVFLLNQSKFRVQLLNRIFILLSRVSNQLLLLITIEVEIEISAEQFTLIEYLKRNH